MKTFIYRRYTFIDEGGYEETQGWKLLKDGQWVLRPNAPEDVAVLISELRARGMTITSWTEEMDNPFQQGLEVTEYVVAVSVAPPVDAEELARGWELDKLHGLS